MDTRLVLAVLFVAGNITLATVTAQNDTVSANTTQSANITTPAPGTNLTANVTAAPGTNVTAAPGTNVTAAPGTNVTAAPGTNVTAAPGTNVTAAPGTNVTAAPGTNVTAAPGTNVTAAPGTNVTAAPGTNVTAAPGTNVTAAPGTNITAAPGTNTTLATTQAPPLEYNDTVESLSTNISRTGCRKQQLCMAQPSDCDPATGSCYFLAVKQKSGQNFEFELAGEADGYLAATVSPNIELVNNASTYVCAKKNGKVFFMSTVNENGKLKQKKLNVNSVKGRTNGPKIECLFAATLPSPVTRASTSTSMSIAISTGTFNSSNDDLGTPRTVFQSPVVELTNVNASVANVANTTDTTTTTSTPTPNHAITLQQSLTQALLITMGVLCLAML